MSEEHGPVSYSVGPETTRLRHRRFAIDDAETFYRLASDPLVNRYTGEPPPASIEDVRIAIANYPDFDTYGYGRWACVLKENAMVIGFCGLKFLPQFGVTDLGYRFLPEYWGRGIATEAGRATLEFGFNTIGLEQIHAFVVPENAASIRVLEKVGMLHVGEVDYDGELAHQYRVTLDSFRETARSSRD